MEKYLGLGHKIESAEPHTPTVAAFRRIPSGDYPAVVVVVVAVVVVVVGAPPAA